MEMSSLADSLQRRRRTRSPPLLIPMLAPLLTLLALALTVSSSQLALVQPPDEQLPLVARVDKPFSWSLSPQTFSSPTGALTYSTSELPPWLAFDPGTLTFHGTPSAADEGYPRISITAKDSSSTTSTTLTLCITSSPEPTLNLPISRQFSAPAPSLSSVFILAPNSAIRPQEPALRVPLKWSFSIGFEYETFLSDSRIYYEARQRDGSALPEWMVFNSDAITVNGYVPDAEVIKQPAVVPLTLYASDQEGYSVAALPFDIIVADHELSLATESLPTINITSATPFSLTLTSPADFSGVLIDRKAIKPSDIMTLIVDTSQYSWLKYDHGSRTLSGDPGNTTFPSGQSPPLLVTLTTAFNQSIRAPMYMAIVPSYFSSSALPPIQAAPGDKIRFNLRQDFSNATGHDNVNLTAAMEPAKVGDWLTFAPDTGELAGVVPSDFDASRITITFTAFSRVSHSTSHASLLIVFAPPDHTKKGYRPHGLSAAAHSRLVLGLGIAFGVVGGLCFIGGILAIIRHCARTQDTAIGDEEGRNVWSEQDKKWYGIGIQRGHGWTDRDPNFTEKRMSSLDHRASYNARHGIQEQYAHLGLGLRRVSERSQSEGSPASKSSPGYLKKREFFTRLRETVRVVSEKAQGRKVSKQRPVIGRPILSAQQASTAQSEDVIPNSSSNPFGMPTLPSHPGSTIVSSPSTSTASHSLPKRNPGFVTPKLPNQVHFEDSRLSRQLSSSSTSSNTSSQRHAAEAVVQTASIRSGRSASGRSFLTGAVTTAGSRPRLVPFTSASRVPMPRRPSSPPGLENGASVSPSKRVVSQTAEVWKRDPTDDLAKGGSSDELQMGAHYVNSLGADVQDAAR
ncbi:hypothetical protein DXG03_009383 [Asterophora parasitica]|uniref:Dystroglycan-type cadherin-like domain-containing protein n=1 Tax=Asterophora parasitica TaxID=117018 RepID=A0A9P7GI06_9AGAR|nr:hypothetical protein DXG03_009383 [Asterophora parasitica]